MSIVALCEIFITVNDTNFLWINALFSKCVQSMYYMPDVSLCMRHMKIL